MALSDTHTILVVDDEPLIRMDISDSLEKAGFETIEAGTAAQAIKILEGRPDIRVIFTDIEMPGDMDGLALSHYVRERWPPTIIVISSGRRKPTQNDMPAGARFLGKPFHSAQLANLLHRIRRQIAAA